MTKISEHSEMEELNYGFLNFMDKKRFEARTAQNIELQMQYFTFFAIFIFNCVVHILNKANPAYEIYIYIIIKHFVHRKSFLHISAAFTTEYSKSIFPLYCYGLFLTSILLSFKRKKVFRKFVSVEPQQ